jgi:hypothetical protein
LYCCKVRGARSTEKGCIPQRYALQPRFHYENPTNVPIVFQLPFTAGKPDNWKVIFSYQRRRPESSTWTSGEKKIIDKVYLSSAKTHAAKAVLSSPKSLVSGWKLIID